MKFQYLDNSKSKWVVENKQGKMVPPVIFECQAETITEADKLYEKAIGKNVMKQPHIGCISLDISST